MARILIPTPLRPYAGGQKEVEVIGATVGEVLSALTVEFAGLWNHLYNDQGKLRSFVNVHLNDDDIRHLERERTAVASSDTMSIVPSIAGVSR